MRNFLFASVGIAAVLFATSSARADYDPSLALVAPSVGAASGIAPLDATKLVPVANLPIGTGSTNVMGGADSRVVTALQPAIIGAASGAAPLDATKLVPVVNLPLITVAMGGTGAKTAAAGLTALGGAPLLSPVFTTPTAAATPACTTTGLGLATLDYVKNCGTASSSTGDFTVAGNLVLATSNAVYFENGTAKAGNYMSDQNGSVEIDSDDGTARRGDLVLRNLYSNGIVQTPSLNANGNVQYAIVAKTASYTIAAGMHLIDATAASAIDTGTLPACLAANAGQEFKVKKLDSTTYAVGFTAAGTDTIDGTASVSTTTQYAVITVTCSATAGKWDRGF
ncbi:MAG: hypothetical protein ACRYGR_09415 [Janthinobacterium lividum]